MIESLLAWLFLILGILTLNANLLIASGVFAVARNVLNIADAIKKKGE